MKEAEMVRPVERCNLCFTRIADNEHLGSALKWSGLVVHAHCLMMCPDVKRRSNDDVCHADVLHCIQRRSSVSCVHCGLAGAAAQCRTCGEAYHLPCGLLSDAWPVFSSSPHSYCSTHRPGPEVPPAHTQGQAQAQACVFCAHGSPSLWAPCCNSGYHRACLQKETSSENVKLNCQVCGEGRKYTSWVVRCGIFLPPRKLQAEEFPLQCSVRGCSLAGKVNRGGAQWELVRCDLCWYQAAHRKCTQSAQVWHCLDCTTALNHCDDTGILTPLKYQSDSGRRKSKNQECNDQSNKCQNKQSTPKDASCSGDSDGCYEYQSRVVPRGKKSFKCGYNGCEEQFNRISERLAHETTHDSADSIQCDYDGCKITFRTSNSLTKHQRNHAASKRFKCGYSGCLYAAKFLYILKKHQSIHTEKTNIHDKASLKCGYDGCEERFIRIKERSAHETTHNGKASIQCDFDGCKSTFRTTSYLAYHKRYHAASKRYKCGYSGCGYAAKLLCLLKRHQKIHTRKTYQCDYDICTAKFNCLARLEAHRVQHTHQLIENTGCECHENDCRLAFTKIKNLKSLQKINADEKQVDAGSEQAVNQSPHTSKKLYEHNKNKSYKKTYECPHVGCKHATAYKGNLKKHQSTHFFAKKYHCSYEGCEAVLSTPLGRKRHQTLHTGDSPFVCHYEGCHKKLSTAGSLKVHILRHSGVKPFSCQYSGCKAAFFSKSDLQKHERIHTGARPYICDIDGCNRTFYQSSALAAHRRRHFGIRPYKCDFGDCSASFNQPGDFHVHYRIHTGERPYRCKFNGCDMAFRSSSALYNHMRRHTDDRRFKCNFCQKAFLSSPHRTQHHRTHTGEKPYTCRYVGCGAAFGSSSNRAVHQSRYHPDTSL